jgi:hypothetical protein
MVGDQVAHVLDRQSRIGRSLVVTVARDPPFGACYDVWPSISSRTPDRMFCMVAALSS